MAYIDFSGLDQIYDELTKLGENAGEAKEAILDAGAAEVANVWIEVAEEREHHESHEMIDAIAPKKVGKDAREIYPQGTDSRGVRNAAKAFYLNYGTPSGRIKGDGWVFEAERRSEERVVAVMQAVWDQYISTGTIPYVKTFQPIKAGGKSGKKRKEKEYKPFEYTTDYWMSMSIKAQNKKLK